MRAHAALRGATVLTGLSCLGFALVMGPVQAAPIAPRAAVICEAGGPCKVGDTGPGGGIVFYDAGSVQPWGRYLEAAPTGWSGKAADPTVPWCSNTTSLVPGALGTDIGTGAANTDNMLAVCSSGAANLARGYSSRVVDTSRPVATAPRWVKAVPGRGSVKVSWSPPFDLGGTTVLSYLVTAEPGGRTCSSTGLTCRITGLPAGSYEFTVAALNQFGWGQAGSSGSIRIRGTASPVVWTVANRDVSAAVPQVVIGGKSDWFLPSADELRALYEVGILVVGFVPLNYWSSSQQNPDFAFQMIMSTGQRDAVLKAQVLSVRPIRAF